VERVIHLLALLFGAGVLGILPFLNHRRLKPGFFQLVTALGGLAILLSLRVAPGGSGSATAERVGAALLVLAILHAILITTGHIEKARFLAWLLLPAGLLAVGLEGWVMPPHSGTLAARALASAALTAGAGLLGSATLALLLGHWYLYSPGLPISHLWRLTTLAAAFIAARFLVFVIEAPALARSSTGASIGAGGSTVDAAAILDSNLPLLAIRFLLGILIPGVLAWMIDRTVRIRSTQAATGLLYVSFIFVLFGEFIAAYLSVLTSVAT
jgi:protein NrfD